MKGSLNIEHNQLCLNRSSVNFIKMKTIDNLSDEVLLEIFKFLDAKTLHNAALACKNWDKVIGSSMVTMKKFKVSVYCENVQSMSADTVNLYHRKHVNLAVHRIGSTLTLKTIENINVAFVRNFKLTEIDDIEDLMKILAKMPLLETLNLRCLSDCSDENRSKIPVLSLPRLKQLEIALEFREFLQYFDVKTLTKLRIGYLISGDDDACYHPFIVDLLRKNRNLESLTVCNIFSKISESYFEFHLKHLSASFQNTESFEKNFSTFLISQASSLESLEFEEISKLNQTSLYSEGVVKTIITKLYRLSTLRIDIANLPENQDFYENLSPNTSLKSLHVAEHENLRIEDFFKGFLSKFPNVEKIFFGSCTTFSSLKFDISCIAAYCPKLTEFSISALSRPIASNVRFMNLKKLNCYSIVNSNSWMSLLASCPSIEHFTLSSCNQKTMKKEDVEFILDQKSLRHLSIRGHIHTYRIVFEVIKTNHKRLRSLEFILSKRTIRFEFHTERSEWNFQEAEDKFNDLWIEYENSLEFQEQSEQF